MAVLLTGGAGYIGSHICIELLQAGMDVVVIDNFSNSKPEAVRRVQQITGKKYPVYHEDLRDRAAVEKIFAENTIDCVIHLAGSKAVGESVQKPILYYDNNLVSTLVLCDVMRDYGCKKIIFSSSATVYGAPEQVPVTEETPVSADTTPYGKTKLFIEYMLQDIAKSDPDWSVILLRYFNPIGAHASGLIGEDPAGIPNNLMPFVTQVAAGKLEKLSVFGTDYDTPDGTCVRDFIHVVDLAQGHVKSIAKAMENSGVFIYNLGTGKGYSVQQLVDAFQQANDIEIPYQYAPRRKGDIAQIYADCSKAQRELGWQAQHDLFEMCRDSWNWQKKNPQGLA
ncbi:UDP-glucose 4-epimerase GalE [Neobittarella massiliensis]|uniref:UDP-glucose 4-epimerase n=1 Tax=Neobittarella massiliensis (ex Bilen et al. 2018) TaxID=2041842 RepID=A0A8J6IQU2_9FIRM|nr:UDP-glucose 4-epimerase GalE [Neobittarella massiliensis]MBC3516801.1 UDP-glucose 4-epimerase GalE [Neobittarella massiliensis]